MLNTNSEKNTSQNFLYSMEKYSEIIYNISKSFKLNHDVILEKTPNNTLGGKGGILYFLNHYLKHYTEKEIRKLSKKILKKMIFDIQNENTELDYFEYQSIIETLFYLDSNGFIQLDFDESIYVMLKQINDYYIENDNWDLLHGFLGLSNMLISTGKYVKCKSIIFKQIEYLNLNKVEIGNGIYWQSSNKLVDYNPLEINFSIAHGNPSIAIMLSKFYKLGFKRSITKELITSSVNYQLSFANINKDKSNIFPSVFDLGNHEAIYGREFGWCYGDASFILMAIHCGKNLKNKIWLDLAYKYALETTYDSYKFTNIDDPMICHGSLGISYLFKVFYDYFGDEVFKLKQEFFLDYTINNFYNIDSNCGFKKAVHQLDSNEKIKYETDFGLIEGNAGLGLILLSFMNPKLKNWDYKFLTNI